MEKEQLKIVFVGHVDHGKSTLIGRLLADTNSLPENTINNLKKTCKEQGVEFEYAFILDHMEEERQQNITIDTAQIFFKTEKRNYVIIDAPGHKEFLKNMITGASQADAAILLIDANEGIKEQTKRHLYILSFLGIEQLIVAINKIDLINYDQKKYAEIKNHLNNFLKELNIKPTHVIPISARLGENITTKTKKTNWYTRDSLLGALEQFKISKIQEKPLRYSVQDVYKINEKRIIVGRIESGVLRVGEDVVFLPSNKSTKVKSIEVFREDKKEAFTGECVGITTEDPLFIERGEVMACVNQPPKTCDKLEANLFWMDKKPLKIDEKLFLKCGTQQVECYLSAINQKINSSTLKKVDETTGLNETEVAKVFLKLNAPLIVENFNEIPELGRFVLIRDGNICAGGIVE